jgi:hypothetical protein
MAIRLGPVCTDPRGVSPFASGNGLTTTAPRGKDISPFLASFQIFDWSK